MLLFVIYFPRINFIGFLFFLIFLIVLILLFDLQSLILDKIYLFLQQFSIFVSCGIAAVMSMGRSYHMICYVLLLPGQKILEIFSTVSQPPRDVSYIFHVFISDVRTCDACTIYCQGRPYVQTAKLKKFATKYGRLPKITCFIIIL